MMGQKSKVLLFGWDAADWKVINPLVDQGLLPNVQKLIENGSISNLATLDPPYSPMLWTSIATGKRPYKHGVLGFSEVTPDGKQVRPVMSTSRKCNALWNILSSKNRRTHVVGWWPSHPAESINGVMISNMFQHVKGSKNNIHPPPSGSVNPESQSEIVGRFRVHPEQLSGEHILPFIPQAKKIDQRKDKRIYSIARIHAHALSLYNSFKYLITHTEWDFAACYLDAIDHFCHGFMRYHPPKRPHIIQEDFDYYHNVVTAAYQLHDLMLGEIISLIDENTILILISDHGFQPDHLRPRDIPREPAGPAYEHSPYGIFAAMGPGIKKDHITYGASLLDITPTVLAICGEAIGEDMDGRIISGIFKEEPEVKTISSWESILPLQHKTLFKSDSNHQDIEEAALKQLEDLGYIEKQTGTNEERIKTTQNECNFNLAKAYIDGGYIDKAIPTLEELFKYNPETVRYGFKLAGCYQVMGRLKDARSIVEGLRGNELILDSALDIMEGTLLMGERQPIKAIKLFKKAEKEIDNPYSRVYIQLASAFMQLQRWEDAERSIKAHLKINFHSPGGHIILGKILFAQKLFDQAVDSFLDALGLDFNNPVTHFLLGKSLFYLGKYEEAGKALENSLKIFPSYVEARELVMKIYKDKLEHNDKYLFHKRAYDARERATIYVVSGLPRSGTSMMMQMLVAGGLNIFTDKKREKDENNPKGYYEHEAVKTLPRNNQWLAAAEGLGIKVIAQLIPYLPLRYNYKILMMERPIEEVLASQKTMLKRIKKGNQNEVYPTSLANKYRSDLRKAIKWASGKANVQLKIISYHQILETPFDIALEINEFLDYHLLPEMMVRVVDKKLYRERG